MTLRPMTQTEFDQYRDYAIEEYARDKMQSLGISREQALILSSDSMAESLPDGLDTPDNYLFSIHVPECGKVGILWVVLLSNWGKTTLFIYDIEVEPDHRNCGYGRAALAKAEQLAVQLGAERVGLHVFGHNTRAFDLYRKLGFEVTDISMAKELVRPDT